MTSPSQLVVTRADLGGPEPVDIRMEGGTIGELAPSREHRFTGRHAAGAVLDAAGGGVVPGLHDHHLHLRSLAAARRSVRAGPPEVATAPALHRALQAAAARTPRGDWIRAVGYHDSVAGPLHRRALDALVPDRPVRVQHRSGALWILNSSALDELGVATESHPGIERESDGTPTGRLFRMDDWLADRVPAIPLDFAAVGAAAAAAGVTGLTDATAGMSRGDVELLAGAVASGALPQRLVVMAEDPAEPAVHPRLTWGPHKVVLDDDALPDPDALRRLVAHAHAQGRAVAFHCVTRMQLIVAVMTLEAAGAGGHDRIEHGAVVPPDLHARLRALGATVVTNPGFVFERGEAYRREVEPEDAERIYPCASLRRAGIAVAAGTDAPFGPADPWVAIRAAADRTTSAGLALGSEERVSPAEAVALFTGRAEAPAVPRRMAAGEPADLCVLALPLRAGLEARNVEAVRATVVDGQVVHDSGG